MEDQVREKFEAWVIRETGLRPLWEYGGYASQLVDNWWHGWMAATASHAAEVEALRSALQRISLAQPDRLDHSIDVGIIERAARIAADALKGEPK